MIATKKGRTLSTDSIDAAHSVSGTTNVPGGWAVRTISDIADVKTGPFGSALHHRDYVDVGTPIITVEHLGESGVIHEGLPLVSDADRSRLASYQLQLGDIVFSRVGAVDRNALIRAPEDGWLFSGRLLRVRVTDKNTFPPYLSFHFKSEPFKRRVRSLAVGQTMGSLNTRILNSLPVVLPPLDEQRAIAEALSDVDELLGSLDALIAKKRAVKQAVMQELLTGKTRLPGFRGKWEKRRLGQLGWFTKGRGIKRDDVSSSGVPCIRYGELYTRYEDNIVHPIDRIPLEVAAGALAISKGVLLFAGSGETASDIGRCAAYLGDEQAYAGGDIIVFNPAGQDSRYLGYLMNHSTVAAQKARMAQGDAVVHISADNLSQVKIALPPLEEQTAIADTLIDMDTEILALEQRRDKTCAIQQGMMQELLTGRMRLNQPSTGTIPA